MDVTIKLISIPNRAKMNADKKKCMRGATLLKKQLRPNMSIGKAVEFAQSTLITQYFPDITSNDPPLQHNSAGYLITLCLHQDGRCKGCFKSRWFNSLQVAKVIYDQLDDALVVTWQREEKEKEKE